MATATHHLREAARLTQQLADQLDRAHAAANHLGYRTPEDDTADRDDLADADPVL